MKILLRVLALCLLIIVIIMTYTRRDSSGAWMVFVSDRDEDFGIFLMDIDSGAVRKVTPDETCANEPRWSPDGRWIAFLKSCYDTGDLFLVRPGGTPMRQLLEDDSFYPDVRWSPDSQHMMVTHGPFGTFILEADGSGERLLTDMHFAEKWSPDGEWIYGQPGIVTESSLDRIHAETGSIEHIVPARPERLEMTWSPDGSQIVLAAGRDLLLMQPDGSTARDIPLEINEPQIHTLQWSPDGEWIAFLAGEQASWRIYRIRPDGRNLQSLMDIAGAPDELQWSSDSTSLYYELFHDGEADILRLHVDTATIDNLTPLPGRDFSPQLASVSGAEWHPFWPMIAAVFLLLLSFAGRLRP